MNALAGSPRLADRIASAAAGTARMIRATETRPVVGDGRREISPRSDHQTRPDQREHDRPARRTSAGLRPRPLAGAAQQPVAAARGRDRQPRQRGHPRGDRQAGDDRARRAGRHRPPGASRRPAPVPGGGQPSRTDRLAIRAANGVQGSPSASTPGARNQAGFWVSGKRQRGGPGLGRRDAQRPGRPGGAAPGPAGRAAATRARSRTGRGRPSPARSTASGGQPPARNASAAQMPAATVRSATEQAVERRDRRRGP